MSSWYTEFVTRVYTCIPVEDESRAVVLGAERLDVAVAPLEPSPSAVVAVVAEE